MPERDDFWEFYWDIRVQELEDLGKREAILAVSKLIRSLAVNPDPPVRLLELGCGEGQIIAPLVEAHAQVRSIHASCGVDYSHRSIEKCRSDYPALLFIESDFTDPVQMAALGQFEIVLLVNALHEVFSAGYSAEVREVGCSPGQAASGAGTGRRGGASSAGRLSGVVRWVGASRGSPGSGAHPLERARKILNAMTLGAVIFGITLSTLHQSGLGALYLMAKDKIHPLWYSEFIPILFLVSSVFAGLSMVIFEGTISHRVFGRLISHEHHARHDAIVLGLARICAGAMFVYLFLQALVFVHQQRFPLLGSGWGAWYLLEMVGLTLVPCVLFTLAARRANLRLVRVAALMTILGIVLNRLNVSVIAFKWYEPVRYWPSWMEIVVTLAVISAEKGVGTG